MRLYLHWPFCRSRCSYCDFNSRVAPTALMDAYREALEWEMRAWARLLDGRKGPLRSLYLGGGTPSCMAGEEVADLLGKAAETFGLEEEAEVTVEVNPSSWERRDFKRAVEGGANRFSVGVQSLDEGVLRLLSRPHGAAEAMEAVDAALSSGARSVGADLLYGLPTPGRDAFLKSLEGAVGLGVHHISAYALTLTDGTPLARRVQRGELRLPSEEESADEYLAACDLLAGRGFEHYEISNFCLPGHLCRHNLAYWRREEYLGLGAGAHSFMGGTRFRNERFLLRYLREIEAGRLPVRDAEAIGKEEAREEMVMLGMRTARGVHERTIRRSRGRLRELSSSGLLALSGGRVALTARGMLVSNMVIADLLYG